MLQAIQYVTGGLTLVAFIAAIFAIILRGKIEERRRRIETIPSKNRIQAARDEAEFFHVDISKLPPERMFEIVMEQIKRRAQRFKIVAFCTVLLGFGFLVLAGLSILKPQALGFPPPSPDAYFKIMKPDLVARRSLNISEEEKKKRNARGGAIFRRDNIELECRTGEKIRIVGFFLQNETKQSDNKCRTLCFLTPIAKRISGCEGKSSCTIKTEDDYFADLRKKYPPDGPGGGPDIEKVYTGKYKCVRG